MTLQKVGGGRVRSVLPATGAFLAVYAAVGAPLLWHETFDGDLFLTSAVLALALAALSAIDLSAYRLPDVLTLPLIPAGIVATALFLEASVLWQVASAAIGYALMAGASYLYERWRGHPGLGLGDAKLLAASGAWVGAEGLPGVLLWACGSALLAVLIARWRTGQLSAKTLVPFGPFLALGTWLVWLYGAV